MPECWFLRFLAAYLMKIIYRSGGSGTVGIRGEVELGGGQERGSLLDPAGWLCDMNVLPDAS
jgi:hypothetical protein